MSVFSAILPYAETQRKRQDLLHRTESLGDRDLLPNLLEAYRIVRDIC